MSGLRCRRPESSPDEDGLRYGVAVFGAVEGQEAPRRGRTPRSARPGRAVSGSRRPNRTAAACSARQVQAGEAASGHPADRCHRHLGAFEVLRLVQRERPDPGAPQGGQVAAGAEGRPRDRGPAPGRRCRSCTPPRRRDRPRRRRRPPPSRRSGPRTGTPSPAGRQGDVLAGTHPRVRAHAADLDGRDRRRHLLDRCPQRGQRGLDRLRRTARPRLAQAVTSPSASSVTVAWPSRMVASYALSVSAS